MSDNYFMTNAFNSDASKAVREAVAKADALGLPKAYSAPPELPTEPIVVRLTTAKTQPEATERSQN